MNKDLCERIRNGECPFGFLKEGQTMSECPSGFPGCGCMDELMLDPGYMEELTRDLESQVSGDEAVTAE